MKKITVTNLHLRYFRSDIIHHNNNPIEIIRKTSIWIQRLKDRKEKEGSELFVRKFCAYKNGLNDRCVKLNINKLDISYLEFIILIDDYEVDYKLSTYTD